MPHILHQLTEHIHWFTPDSATDRPILGLVTGEHSSLMVDAGASVKHTNEFLEAVKQANLSPPDYCALTHWHWDHSFGAEALDIPLIAHKRTAENLATQARYSFSNEALDERVEQGLEIAFCRDYMKLEMTQEERFTMQLHEPDIIFEDTLNINLGSIGCELKHVAGDHADDSVVIYVPEDKVLFLGDATYQCLYSNLPHYSSQGVFDLVKKLSNYEVMYALESHTDELYSKESFCNYLKVLESFASLVRNISDEITLKHEIKTQLPTLAQEDIEDYTIMFLNGLKMAPLSIRTSTH